MVKQSGAPTSNTIPILEWLYTKAGEKKPLNEWKIETKNLPQTESSSHKLSAVLDSLCSNSTKD